MQHDYEGWNLGNVIRLRCAAANLSCFHKQSTATDITEDPSGNGGTCFQTDNGYWCRLKMIWEVPPVTVITVNCLSLGYVCRIRYAEHPQTWCVDVILTIACLHISLYLSHLLCISRAPRDVLTYKTLFLQYADLGLSYHLCGVSRPSAN